jgi:hypothetical protein
MMTPARDVHADLAGRPALLQDACRRALAYLAALADRPVAPPADAVAALSRLDFALPADGYGVLNDVVLNQVLVDLGARTGAIIAAVQNEGTCWCGPTTWDGRTAMRVSVSCWNTTEADIDRSVAAVLACASGRPHAGVR